jgi:hypothetical protein
MLPLILPLRPLKPEVEVPEPRLPTPRLEMELGVYGRHAPVGWNAGRFARLRLLLLFCPFTMPVMGRSEKTAIKTAP